MRANPSFYTIFIGLAVGFDDNRAAGVILGRSLLEGRLTLAQALRC